MSRDDLLKTNQNIVRSVTEEVVKYSPETILVMVANPLDAMCHVAMEVSGFPRERVVGMAGILDTARYRTFIAQELRVSVRTSTRSSSVDTGTRWSLCRAWRPSAGCRSPSCCPGSA